MENYYELLEVAQTATYDEIKKSFRKLAKKYHPDTNVNDKTLGPKFQKINEAYGVLGDEKLRKEYDDKLAKSKNSKQNNKNEAKDNRRKTGTNKQSGDIKSAMENLNSQFEQFFGFNANSNEVKSDFGKKKNDNPIDTSRIFDSFFKAKKK